MMILTDPRKGIWIVPGVSLQRQNDMKYTSNGFIQNRSSYLTLSSPLFFKFKHKRSLILNHCQNRSFSGYCTLVAIYSWDHSHHFAPSGSAMALERIQKGSQMNLIE